MKRKSSGWTPERRARQAELIRNWKPWERSTGPNTDEGRANSSRNAYKHGGRSAKCLGLLSELRGLLREQRDALKEIG